MMQESTRGRARDQHRGQEAGWSERTKPRREPRDDLDKEHQHRCPELPGRNVNKKSHIADLWDVCGGVSKSICVFVRPLHPILSHPHRDHRIGIYSSMCSPHTHTLTLATVFIQSRQRPDAVNVAVAVAACVAVNVSCAAAGNPYQHPLQQSKQRRRCSDKNFTKTT